MDTMVVIDLENKENITRQKNMQLFISVSEQCKYTSTEYIFYCKRAILFLSSSKRLTPIPPLRPESLSSPRNKGGGTHSPGGEGDGGSIFWKTREIGLPSYSKICTLCIQVNERYKLILSVELKIVWDVFNWK
jgi:hypothetical protein